MLSQEDVGGQLLPRARRPSLGLAELDRLRWAGGLSFVASGLRIGIRVSEAQMLDRLPRLLPPGARPSTSPVVETLFSVVVGGTGPGRGAARDHVVYAGASRILQTHDLEAALERLADRVQMHVAERAPRRIFVHAGVVSWQGRAILIPGRSHSGKSWLVRALVRSGAEYYSDEYGVLDAQGRVHPYPLPLTIRGAGGRRARAVDDPGVRAGRGPSPCALVVVTRYVPGGRWRPRVLSRGQAVLELLSHTVPARRSPGRALQALSRVVAGARVVKGVRGEADETVRDILDAARRPGAERVTSSTPVVFAAPQLSGGSLQ